MPLHADACRQRLLYTQMPLHTDAFTHEGFYTQMLLHTDTFTYCCQNTLQERKDKASKHRPSFHAKKKVSLTQKKPTLGLHVMRKGRSSSWPPPQPSERREISRRVNLKWADVRCEDVRWADGRCEDVISQGLFLKNPSSGKSGATTRAVFHSLAKTGWPSLFGWMMHIVFVYLTFTFLRCHKDPKGHHGNPVELLRTRGSKMLMPWCRTQILVICNIT